MATNPLSAPEGLYYVATSLAQAQAWAQAVDAQQGYPRPGTELGTGFFVKDSGGGPFVTQTYANIWAHPTLAQWAYVSDSTTSTILPSPPTPQLLDPSWALATAAPKTAGAVARVLMAVRRMARRIFG